jgi:hypothetical protein
MGWFVFDRSEQGARRPIDSMDAKLIRLRGFCGWWLASINFIIFVQSVGVIIEPHSAA